MSQANLIEAFRRGVRAMLEGPRYSFLLHPERDSISVTNDANDAGYEVSVSGCSCPDFQHRCAARGIRCKHVLMVKLNQDRIQTV